MNPKSVRDYLAGLERADAFEIEELRRAPAELKLRQIWSLMTSVDLFEDEQAREAGITEVRERWQHIRQALA